MTRRPGANWSLSQQAFALRQRLDGAQIQLRQTHLACVCRLRPSPLSRTYTVKISFDGRRYPCVWVLAPTLEGRPEESLPHVFREGSLCLHRDEDWSAAMLIADTIVPWASEWLFYYELWLLEGEWYGGGEWPPARPAQRPTAPGGIMSATPTVQEKSREEQGMDASAPVQHNA